MRTGRLYNKELTAVAGTGLSQTGTTNQKVITPPAINVSTPPNPFYPGEEDSIHVLTGAGEGDAVTSGGTTPHRWGHTAPSGSRVEINDSGGAERVELVHHSGASVVIDPDGGVYVNSTSRRGVGIGAPLGDAYIAASGEIIISGKGSVSITTVGDLTLDVGGTLNIKCTAYNLVTNTSDETIDGSASRSVTNDQSQVIGGINRITVAGDAREQVSGVKITDVGGDSTTRVDGDSTTDVGGKKVDTVKGDHNLSSQGKMKILAGGTMEVNAGDDLEVASSGDVNIGADGDLNAKASGSAHFGSAGSTNLTGSITTVSASGAAKLTGGSSAKVSSPASSIHSPTVTIGATTLVSVPPTGSAGPSVDSTISLGSVAAPTNPEGPKEAEVMEGKDIVDTMTSARKYPDYPGNGVLEGANKTGLGMISHDSDPSAEGVFNEYSGGNTGNMNPGYSGGEYDHLSEDPVNRPDGIDVQDPGVSVPAPHNNGVKISKYFTLGELVNAKLSHRIPAGKWDSVVKQIILLANNVLDPIREKFPDMIVTNVYRGNSPNHVTGRAADIVVESRSLTRHAEIARFARDNLPADQVFLERNTSGRTHVHVRVGSGKPTVLTCADPQCRSSEPGIKVEYLSRRGVA